MCLTSNNYTVLPNLHYGQRIIILDSKFLLGVSVVLKNVSDIRVDVKLVETSDT